MNTMSKTSVIYLTNYIRFALLPYYKDGKVICPPHGIGSVRINGGIKTDDEELQKFIEGHPAYSKIRRS